MGALEKIIALGLAAAAALYIHSTYIAATRQNDVPEYIAAGSKVITDAKNLGKAGKEVYDSVSEAVRQMNEYKPKEKDNIFDGKGNPPYKE